MLRATDLADLKPVLTDYNNNEDFIDIDPYQISCLYGGDKLAVNFTVFLYQMLYSDISAYHIIASKADLFSVKLLILRLLNTIMKFKYYGKCKKRIKLYPYLIKKYTELSYIVNDSSDSSCC